MTLALSILTAPLAINAQPPATMSRIGVLRGGALTPESAHGQQAFQQGLHDLGWVEGHNIGIEYRYAAGSFERLPDLAAEPLHTSIRF
jgi:putative ABC transport system substrate-binding protein